MRVWHIYLRRTPCQQLFECVGPVPPSASVVCPDMRDNRFNVSQLVA